MEQGCSSWIFGELSVGMQEVGGGELFFLSFFLSSSFFLPFLLSLFPFFFFCLVQKDKECALEEYDTQPILINSPKLSLERAAKGRIFLDKQPCRKFMNTKLHCKNTQGFS